MRVLVLGNRRSGKPAGRRRLDAIVSGLRAAGAAVDVELPDSAEAMRARAERVSRFEHDALLVAGGDGTLHAVVNGLVRAPRDRRPKLAVAPLGRGNDFAGAIGIRSESDTLSAIASGRSRPVDLGRAGSFVFLGIAGTGFDARAARRAQQTPLLTGSLLYTYAVLRTLVDFRPLGARVRYDGGAYEGPITFVACGNTTRYGGGMHITPHAEVTDGLLDLCLVKEISRATLLRMFPTVFSGSHLGHPSVLYARSSFVEIETDEPAEVFADGEFLQRTPVRVDVLRGELDVLTPPGGVLG
jgi:diacylglycerol kinase (ATP)